MPLTQARRAHPPPPRLNAVQRGFEEHLASHWARVMPGGVLSRSGQSLLLNIAPLGHRFHVAAVEAGTIKRTNFKKRISCGGILGKYFKKSQCRLGRLIIWTLCTVCRRNLSRWYAVKLSNLENIRENARRASS